VSVISVKHTSFNSDNLDLRNDLMSSFRQPQFEKDILTIVGGYGSGKSEVSVNLAAHMARRGTSSVTIADLDIVNPYFRSREAIEALDRLGIRSIVPMGGQQHADLPIVLPEVKGAIEHNEGILILDVGGDDVGSRVLSSLTDAFPQNDYEMLLVLNANRPFTETVANCMKLIGEIEEASRLKVTGLISNTHLLEDTTPEIVYAGMRLAREVSKAASVPIIFCSSTTAVAQELSEEEIDVPMLELERMLLKPWETKEGDKPHSG